MGVEKSLGMGSVGERERRGQMGRRGSGGGRCGVEADKWAPLSHVKTIATYAPHQFKTGVEWPQRGKLLDIDNGGAKYLVL